MTARIDALLDQLTTFDGIARRRRLLELGHSRHTQHVAIETGRVIAACRLWIARTDVDARLRQAAERGVVLTCVTAAERLGCWT